VLSGTKLAEAMVERRRIETNSQGRFRSGGACSTKDREE
jgi:hypothetical protein